MTRDLIAREYTGKLRTEPGTSTELEVAMVDAGERILHFGDLPDRTKFPGPDGRMYMKLGNGILPIRLTREGGEIGWGTACNWNPEWDSKMTFVPLEREKIETAIAANRVPRWWEEIEHRLWWVEMPLDLARWAKGFLTRRPQ